MSRLHGVILRPMLTEKTTQMDALNKIVFKVRKDASKHQVREAVEQLFGVRVKKVNTAIMPGKPKRFGRQIGYRAGFKKAVVTLADGEVLDFFQLEEFGEDEGAELE